MKISSGLILLGAILLVSLSSASAQSWSKEPASQVVTKIASDEKAMAPAKSICTCVCQIEDSGGNVVQSCDLDFDYTTEEACIAREGTCRCSNERNAPKGRYIDCEKIEVPASSAAAIGGSVSQN
jgi:hypothetical protein